MADEPKFYLTSTGCLSLRMDTTRLFTYLKRNGYKETKSAKNAEKIIITTCIVTKYKESHSLGLIKKLLRDNPKARIIVAGCGAKTEQLNKKLKNVSYINTWELFEQEFPGKTSLSEIGYLGTPEDLNYTPPYLKKGLFEHYASFERTLFRMGGEIFSDFFRYGTQGIEFIDEPSPSYRVVVSTGCPYSCSYCIVRFLRGKYTSVPEKSILDQIGRGWKKGYRKFLLIADDLGFYGYDLEKRRLIGRLLSKIFSKFPTARLALRYLEPMDLPYIWKDLSKHLRSGRIFYVNIPIQTASKKLLLRMNRRTQNKSLELIRNLRNNFSGSAITHIMTGHPGETPNDLRITSDFLESAKFSDVIVHRFSPRPGTPLEKACPSRTVKEGYGVLLNNAKKNRVDRFKEFFSLNPTTKKKLGGREVEYRFREKTIPAEFLKKIKFSGKVSQQDIVLMHPSEDGFVARIRKEGAGFFLQFKARKSENFWNEFSVKVHKKEALSAYKVLSEFMEPVASVRKMRSSGAFSGVKIFRDSVFGIGNFVEFESDEEKKVASLLARIGLEKNCSLPPYGKILNENLSKKSLALETRRAVKALFAEELGK